MRAVLQLTGSARPCRTDRDEADGELAKVTRSTTIDEIRGAAELCVQPKARR